MRDFLVMHLTDEIRRVERFQIFLTWNINELRFLAYKGLICLELRKVARRKKLLLSVPRFMLRFWARFAWKIATTPAH